MHFVRVGIVSLFHKIHLITNNKYHRYINALKTYWLVASVFFVTCYFQFSDDLFCVYIYIEFTLNEMN